MKMYQANYDQQQEVLDQMNPFSGTAVAIEIQPDHESLQLLANLSAGVAWGNRQAAARKLGHIKCQEAVPALVEALPDDPFWMVRCDIIQALEKIGDPRAIPALRQVSKNDGFQVVRAYAAKAIERLYEKV
jgi:HEAT repeat protein